MSRTLRCTSIDLQRAAFAKGVDLRKISDELNSSPTTVRNHLQAIHLTLSDGNKVELARIILEAED